MKKLLMFIVILSITFVLAGCDLLPEDVEDILSEELCREDPNNELCDVDNLEELEEEIVKELVADAFMKAKEKANKTKCSMVISPTNPDLIDECMMEESTMIPEGVTDFDPFKVEIKGLTAFVTGTTNNDGEELTITVTFVEIDGKSYIDSWSTTRDAFLSHEISMGEAETYFKMFWDSFFDVSLTNDEFCRMYFDEGIDNDCDGIRTELGDIDQDGLQDVVLYVSSVTDEKRYEFRGHVTVLKIAQGGGGGGGMIATKLEVEMEVFRQEFGPVMTRKLSIQDPSEPVDILGMGEEKLKMMVMDFYNPDITDEEFNKMYDYNSSRSNTTRRVESIYVFDKELQDDGSVDISYRVKFKAGSSLSEKVNIAYDDSDDNGAVYVFRRVALEPGTYENAQFVIDSFFDVFTDLTVDDKEFDEMFHGAYSSSRFYQKRKFAEEAQAIMIEELEPGLFKVEGVLTFKDGAVEHWTLEVRVNRIELAIVGDFNDLDDDCDGIDDDCNLMMPRELAIQNLNFAFDSFFDIHYSNQELDDMFFDNMAPESFHDWRTEMVALGIALEVVDIFGPTKAGHYLVVYGSNGMRVGEPLKVGVSKPVDKATPLLSIVDPDDDNDSIPLEERLAFIHDYKERHNHMSALSTTMCATLVPEHRIYECTFQRDRSISMGLIIEDYVFFDLDNGLGLLRIRKRPDLLVSEWEYTIEDSLVFIYEDPRGAIVMEMIPEMIRDVEMMTVDTEMLAMQLSDFTIPVDQVCMLLSNDSYDECVKIRTFMETNSLYAENGGISKADAKRITLTINFYNAAGEFVGDSEYDARYVFPSLSSVGSGNILYIDRGMRGENPLFTSNE